MREPAGEKTAGPLRHAVPPTPAPPLSAYLPLQAPSMNSLLTMYCIGSKPKVEMKAEVRLFRFKMTSMLPKWECPKHTLLHVHLAFHDNWLYGNRTLRKKDVANLLKCCYDCIFQRYRVDDAWLWNASFEKVHDPSNVGIQLRITPLDNKACLKELLEEKG